MQGIAFCRRCRGMRVGWNGRYLIHCLFCKTWIPTSSKLLILTVFIAVFVLAFPTPSALVFPDTAAGPAVVEAGFPARIVPVTDPAIHAMETFLRAFGVDESNRGRVAESIVNAARKYDLEPRLIASIVIIESRANPFAISGSDAIGIMQIHLPTWGQTAERQGVNLFKIEDNIDFGAHILKDYVRQAGLWEGVKRYKGWVPEDAESEQSALDYVSKVQHIYGIRETVASTTAANLLQ
jgi:Transglycosylase SLT domain